MPAPPPPLETRWKPGVSGNPKGRSKVSDAIRELAKSDSTEAYNVVKNIMLTGDKDTTRLAAAIAILKAAGVSFNAEDGTDTTVTVRPSVAAPPRALADGLAPQEPIN